MRNLGLVFFFIVVELFLQGCIPGTGHSILIRSKDQSVLSAGNKAEILKVVELTGKQYGYTQESDLGENVQLGMCRKHEEFSSTIYVYYEKDFVKIYIGEIGTRTLRKCTIEVQDEIIGTLNDLYSVSIIK